MATVLVSDGASAQGLNVDAWLQRPGVKLLAVEFYATWCKPCMAAVPRWKALHEKYRRQGLRFVVVATQDADGACANPGWAPDALVCDDDGFLAQRFGAQKLPSAYLWSWNGELLAKQTHVDDVEAKIQAWMRRTPRVDVDVGRVTRGSGVDKRALRSLVRGELRRTDKLVVVATAAERRALRQIVKDSLRASADEALACQVGAEVSANSLLTATIVGRRRQRLQLKLLSAERGCLIASASTDWRSDNPDASVSEAVAELMGRLRLSPTQYPWSRGGAAVSQVAPPPPTQSVDLQALARQAEEAERRLREAEAQAAREKAARQKALEADWGAASKVATTSAMDRGTRMQALRVFLDKYPSDNPHLETAQGYLAKLRRGEEPIRAPGNMVDVPGGPFFMGCNEAVDTECDEDEKPGRTVSVEAFRIDKTEVTVAAYKSCVDAGDCKRDTFGTKSDNKYCNWGYSDRGQHPMNCVSWFGADAYCRSQGQRLPTEAEWEKAARGTDRRTYAWGNKGFGGVLVANIADASAKRVFPSWTVAEGYDDGFVATAPVGSFSPAGDSPFGAQDMIGNVWEWTADWYVYGDIGRGKFRSLRGGSWHSGPWSVRASNRLRFTPSDRSYNVGFRCVQSG